MSSMFLDQQVIGKDSISFYVNVSPQSQDVCLEVVTYSSNGYVAFKTGDIEKSSSNYVLTWERHGLRRGTYWTGAELKTSCSDEGKIIMSAKSEPVTLD